MAVVSRPTGGVILTGRDAKTFDKKLDAQSVSDKTVIAAAEGREMAREFEQHGFVRLRLK